jgi:hypothetical protein
MLSLGRVLQRVVRLCCAHAVLTVDRRPLRGARLRLRGVGPRTSAFNLLPHQRYVRSTRVQRHSGRSRTVVVVQADGRHPHGLWRAAWLRRAGGGALAASARVGPPSNRRHPPRRTRTRVNAASRRCTTSPTDRHPRRAARHLRRDPDADRLVDGINQYVGAMLLPSDRGRRRGRGEGGSPRLLRALLGGMSGLTGTLPLAWMTPSRPPAPALANNGYFLTTIASVFRVIDLAECCAPRRGATAVLAIRRAVRSAPGSPVEPASPASPRCSPTR